MVFYQGHKGLWIAWVFLQLAFTFDCMDGSWARLKNMHSPVGTKFDFLVDEIKVYFLFPAVGYRLYLETDSIYFLYLSLAGTAVIASGLSMTNFIRSPEYSGKNEHSARSYKKGPIGWIMRFFSFVLNYPSWILIPVIFNRMDWFLYVSLSVYCLYLWYALFQIVNKVGRYSHYEERSDGYL